MFKRRFSIKAKVLIVVTLILGGMCILLELYSGRQMYKMGEKLMGEKALATVTALSYQINGDDLEQFIQKNEQDSEYADKMNEVLKNVKDSVGCRYVYVMSKVGENDYEYALEDDGDIGDIEDVSDYDSVFKAAMNNGESGFTGIEKDPEYGSLLSAVAPINDSNGDIAGIICCDIQANTVNNEVQSFQVKYAVISLILFLIGELFVYFFMTPLINVIKRNISLLQQLAKGDLSDGQKNIDVKRQDEIGDLANAIDYLKKNMQKIIRQLSTISHSVFDSSKVLENVSSITQSTTEEIAKAVEEIAAESVKQAQIAENVSQQANHIGDGVDNTTNAVGNLYRNSEEMKKSGDNALQSIAKLNDVNNTTKIEIDKVYLQTKETNESVGKIQEAANLISSIAEKTNLLSLNASIEAARAGDSGRGFAVVADQIKQLAEQSDLSAKSITNTINTLIGKSDLALDSMEHINETVKIQNEYFVNTKESFDIVYNGINRTTEEAKKISSIAGELKKLQDSVMSVIQTLNDVSDESAASSEETSASLTQLTVTYSDVEKEVKSLRKISDLLVQSIAVFKM